MNTTPPVKKLRVMLVDDHIMIQLGLKDGFRQRPEIEIVGIAASGQEGMDSLIEHNPDITILDYRLPDITGAELAKKMLKQKPETPILMLTAYESEEDLWRAVKAGVKGYLSKEAGIDEICHALQTISNGGTYFPEKFARMLALRGRRQELTKREMEILELLGLGSSNKEIMTSLNLSHSTVRNHVSNLLAKLDTQDRTQAVVKAVRRGLIHLDD